MVKDYLNALISKGNFSSADVAKMSGVPEATIRKIRSGETAEARFETIAKLVTALGGSLDEAFSSKKEKDIKENAVTILKSESEMRIDEYRERLEQAQRDRRILAIALAIAVGVLVSVLLIELGIVSCH